MSGMLERVARSIYEKRNGAGCKPWSLQPKAHKEPYLGDARAAMDALSNPTPEMTIAGAMTLPDYEPGTDDAEECWRAMFTAALNEKSPATPAKG